MEQVMNVTIVFKVEGKEEYVNTSEYRNLPPKKVVILEKLLMEGQKEFIKQASKF